MILSKERLFHIKVRTRSGVYVGRVVNISFDTGSHSVLQYHVRMARLMAKLFPFLFKKHILFISHTQIVEWKEGEMIVENTIKDVYTHTTMIARTPHAQEALPLHSQKRIQQMSSCSSTDRAAPS